MIRKTVKNSLGNVLSSAFRRVRISYASLDDMSSQDNKQRAKVDSDDVTLAGSDASERSTLVSETSSLVPSCANSCTLGRLRHI